MDERNGKCQDQSGGQPMRACWATDYPGASGNSLGYHYHDKNMRQSLLDAGCVFDADAPVAVHVTPPHAFRPIPGKKNIVSCAWEAHELPENFRVLEQADWVAVTAKYLVEPFREFLGGRVPVSCLYLGVHADQFPLVNRLDATRRPVFRARGGRRLRFLWVGAPNARKGPLHVIEAWKAFADNPNCELYLKTSMPADCQDKAGVKQIGNVTFDSRRVPMPELVRIYHEAHAFLFPSVGEGFGLTLGEAACTGLPCVYTPWTSMSELLPPSRELGYPIGFGLAQQDWSWENFDGPGTKMQVNVTIASPDTTDLARQMFRVMANYPEACRRGRNAAQHIRDKFTWQRCGHELSSIIRAVQNSISPGEAMGLHKILRSNEHERKHQPC